MAYKLMFKRQPLADEWSRLARVNPKLCHIVLKACECLNGEITLTEIYRDEETQRRYYPKEPDKMSVHQFWRGVDVSIKNVGCADLGACVLALNIEFPYGKKNIKTALVHDVGLGRHLHLQTIDGGC